MSGQKWAHVLRAPGTDNYGLVKVDGRARRCYFDPRRYKAPWPTPTVGDRVAVAEDRTRTISALWLLGKGLPS